MNRQRVYGFDIDDVLFPLRATLVRSVNERFRCRLNIEKYDCYSLTHWLRRDHPEVAEILERSGGREGHLNWLANSGLLLETPPYDGVPELMDGLKSRDIKIAIPTFRGTGADETFYEKCKRQTWEWFRRYRIEYDYMKFTGDKGKALQQLEDSEGLFLEKYSEDHPSHIIEVVQLGYCVTIVDQPHNRRKLPKEMYERSEIGLNHLTPESWREVLRDPNKRISRVQNVRDIAHSL